MLWQEAGEGEEEEDYADYIDAMDECDEDEQAVAGGGDENDEVEEEDHVSSYTSGGVSPSISNAPGDIPGLPVGHAENIFMTQPAIWDLQADSAICIEDDGNAAVLRTENWLGKIHASSGIRRTLKDGTTHEIDWALVDIHPNRRPSRNTVRGGARFCDVGKTREEEADEDLHPGFVVPMSQLAEKKVHASGRTSGLQTGTVCCAMGAVMLPGRETFAEFWCVIGKLGGKIPTSKKFLASC